MPRLKGRNFSLYDQKKAIEAAPLLDMPFPAAARVPMPAMRTLRILADPRAQPLVKRMVEPLGPFEDAGAFRRPVQVGHGE